MSVTYVPAELKRLVLSRADGLCEYCLIAEDDTFFGRQIDHVISEKHGGQTTAENLAVACAICNRAKGSDIGSIESGVFVRLFNPRIDLWHEHFVLVGSVLEPRTLIGVATVRLLRLNADQRLLERASLIDSNRYPNAAARKRMNLPLE